MEVLDQAMLVKIPEFSKRLNWFLRHRPQLSNLVPKWIEPGTGERTRLSLLHGDRLRDLLRRMLDPEEFLSEFGVRSMSKAHLEAPCDLAFAGMRFNATYTPGEGGSYRIIRGQLELARPDLDAGQLSAYRLLAEVLFLFWSRLSRRMPSGIG